MHDGLHVVSREESSDAVTDAFEPAVIVLLDYVDDGPLHEGQLVLFVLGVVVDSHNWEEANTHTVNSSECKHMYHVYVGDEGEAELNQQH